MMKNSQDLALFYPKIRKSGNEKFKHTSKTDNINNIFKLLRFLSIKLAILLLGL